VRSAVSVERVGSGEGDESFRDGVQAQKMTATASSARSLITVPRSSARGAVAKSGAQMVASYTTAGELAARLLGRQVARRGPRWRRGHRFVPLQLVTNPRMRVNL
jgi:hypothetical protein